MADPNRGERRYFAGKRLTHCACGSVANACANWIGPTWQNPWTGKNLRHRTATWNRVTRHCRFPDGREDESSGPPKERRLRRVLNEAAVVGPAAEADIGDEQGGNIEVPEIQYGSSYRRKRGDRCEHLIGKTYAPKRKTLYKKTASRKKSTLNRYK